MKHRLRVWSIVVLSLVSEMAAPGDTGQGAGDAAEAIASAISQNCLDCHNPRKTKGGLDLSKLPLDLADSKSRARWVQIHDRIQKREMPPDADDLPAGERSALLALLDTAIGAADLAEVAANGRGPMRRLNREEYENNLRDLLQLPNLDIRDMLPEDRAQNGFNKSAMALDISRVQLAAYLDAADAALRAAIASGEQSPPADPLRSAGHGDVSQRRDLRKSRGHVLRARFKMLPLKEQELTELRQSGRARSPGRDGPLPFRVVALLRLSSRLRREDRGRIPREILRARRGPGRGLPAPARHEAPRP